MIKRICLDKLGIDQLERCLHLQGENTMKSVIVSQTITDTAIRFTQEVEFDVDLPIIPEHYLQSASNLTPFPGREQFLKDAVNILENEFKFDIIEDKYNDSSDLQKGYTSDRDNSNSIYIDSYYDLKHAEYALDYIHTTDKYVPQNVKVRCFIHFRFSDHKLENVGYQDHNKFLDQNAEKYTKGKNIDDKFIVKEFDETFLETELYQYYEDALDTLRGDVASQIYSWVRYARKLEARQRM